MELIDGRKIAESILNNLQERVKRLSVRPVLCDVLVGNDEVSLSYVNIKSRTAEKIGIEFCTVHLPSSVTPEALAGEIQALNAKASMCGLIVQLPLPPEFDVPAVLNAIDPLIDVDCIGAVNSEEFYRGRATLVPPTAGAIMKMLDGLNLPLEGKRFFVVGQGNLVGKPVTFLLKQRGFTVEVADRETDNLRSLLSEADVVISGTGQPGLIRGDMIKPGAVVIDAGTAESDGGIVGDIDRASVSEKASYLSPVPGGVGPVTVAMLLSNVVGVAERKLV